VTDEQFPPTSGDEHSSEAMGKRNCGPHCLQVNDDDNGYSGIPELLN